MPVGEPHVYVNLLPNLKSNFANHMPQLDFHHWERMAVNAAESVSNTILFVKVNKRESTQSRIHFFPSQSRQAAVVLL